MLTLTERAIAEISDILVVQGAPPDCGARLLVTEDKSVRLVIDSPRETDQVVVGENATLVLIDPGVAESLGASEIDIDVSATTDDERFVIRRCDPALCT